MVKAHLMDLISHTQELLRMAYFMGQERRFLKEVCLGKFKKENMLMARKKEYMKSLMNICRRKV